MYELLFSSIYVLPFLTHITVLKGRNKWIEERILESMLPGAREAYLPIEGTDLDTEANQLVPLSLVGIIPINQSLPDLRSLKYRHERAQDRALDEQGKATELYEQGNLSVIVVRSYRRRD
jgi:hypothetical protein